MTPTNPVLKLAAQATGTVTKDVTLDPNSKGVIIHINIKSSTGTLPTLLIAVANIVPDGADSANPNVSPAILTGAALAAGSTGVQTPMVIYPGIAVVSNVTANSCVAQTIRISATVAGTTPTVTADISVTELA